MESPTNVYKPVCKCSFKTAPLQSSLQLCKEFVTLQSSKGNLNYHQLFLDDSESMSHAFLR